MIGWLLDTNVVAELANPHLADQALGGPHVAPALLPKMSSTIPF